MLWMMKPPPNASKANSPESLKTTGSERARPKREENTASEGVEASAGLTSAAEERRVNATANNPPTAA